MSSAVGGHVYSRRRARKTSQLRGAKTIVINIVGELVGYPHFRIHNTLASVTKRNVQNNNSQAEQKQLKFR